MVMEVVKDGQWPPGTESQEDPHVQAIARTAKDLEQRENWLKADPTPGPFPHGERGECIGSVGANLTRLYNARPTWLDLAHKRLDEAVFTPMAGNPI